MSITTTLQDPMVDRRWAGLAVLFLAQMVAIGTTSFAYGLFVAPLSEAYGLSRADASSGLILILVGMAVWSPFIGRRLDTIPPRRVLLAGTLLFSTGLILTGVSTRPLVSAVAAFTLIAGGAAALGPLSGSTLAARWFGERRGRALGIVAVSSSMGGFLVVPMLGWLIVAIGWRWTLISVGATFALLMTVLILAVIRDPAIPLVGSDKNAVAGGDQPLTPRQLMATRDLWLLVFLVGTMLGIAQMILSTIIAHVGDQGVSLQRATLLVSAASASSVLGKLAIGALADRIDLRWLQVAVVAAMATFLVVLSLRPSYSIILAACLLAGVSIGGTTPLWAAFVSQRFGARSVGMAMGLMIFLQLPLIFGILRFSGAMFDRNGSYDGAYLVFAAITPLVALAVLPLKRRPLPPLN